MFSSSVFYVWVAWLLALAALAVIRLKIHQCEEQQREERRQQREAHGGPRPIGAVRRQARRSALPADYRNQLIAAGVIRPATAPEITEPASSL